MEVVTVILVVVPLALIIAIAVVQVVMDLMAALRVRKVRKARLKHLKELTAQAEAEELELEAKVEVVAQVLEKVLVQAEVEVPQAAQDLDRAARVARLVAEQERGHKQQKRRRQRAEVKQTS